MKINLIAELIKALYQADFEEELGEIVYEGPYFLIGYIRVNNDEIEGLTTTDDIIDFYNEMFRGES